MSKDVISQAQLAGVDWSAHEPGQPAMDYEPSRWMTRPDVTWHASAEHPMPEEEQPGEMSYDIRHEHGYGGGFHSGTQQAAMERAHLVKDRSWAGDIVNTTLQPKDARNYVHPVRLTSDVALSTAYFDATGQRYNDKLVFTDSEANESAKPATFYSRATQRSAAEQHMGQGQHVPYMNTAEDYGSISYRSPRDKLRTWSEDVLSDPNAPRQHRVLAEQFDLTVPARENAAEIVRHEDRDEKFPMQDENPGGSGTAYEQRSLFPGQPSEFHGSSSAISIMSPRFKRKW